MNSRASISSDQGSLATLRLLRTDPELNEKRGEYEGRSPRLSTLLTSTRLALAGHLTILLMYSLIFVFATKLYLNQNGSLQRASSIYTPASDAISYERVKIDTTLQSVNPFKGPPSPDLDRAWSDMLYNANIRITADSLKRINQTSIPLADGDGFYGILDVYHQLHCLKYIRHHIYQDYYGNVHPWTPAHVDHCIDSIRQNLMCHADLSVMTFHWVEDSEDPKPNFKYEHECVNWKALEGWASKRAFDIDDPTMLVRPEAM